MRLCVGAGVYGSVGLWANYKTKIDDKKEKDPIKWFNKDESGMHPFDFGASVFASLWFGRVGVNVGYQPGLMTFARKPDGGGDADEVKNNSFYVSLSYLMHQRL